jgi:nicotinamidase-related amidase
VNRYVAALLFCAAIGAAQEKATRILHLDLRSRVEAFRGSGIWQEVHLRQDLPVAKTAIVICDMWDKHWCAGASRRVDTLADRMAPVVDASRAHGIQIIHAPSDVMEFYRDTPQRRRLAEAVKIEPAVNLNLTDPPLPIDDSNGGCDTPETFYKAWTREHSRIRIAPEDGISDKGAEIYSFLRGRGVETVLIMGVHTNMCILNRSFAIRQMTKWGVRCILVRDLTDSMYNPSDRPFVSHDHGTELVVEHIEKYWAPTLTSSNLMHALNEAK